MVNAHTTEEAPVTLKVSGISKTKMMSWRALYTNTIHDHNTFEHPTQVEPKNESISDGKLQLAPASVNIMQFGIE